MKLDFRKNVKRNMLANAANSGIRLLFPFLNRTLFLWLLSPAFLGLNGLFSSILAASARPSSCSDLRSCRFSAGSCMEPSRPASTCTCFISSTS